MKHNSDTIATQPKANSTKLVRGSSLMLIGRFCSVGINFLVQVLIVRALAKTEFGAFAFAMSIMSIGSSLAVMGMGKTFEYFVPIHQERGEFRDMAGTVILVVLSVFGMGLGITCLILAGHDVISRYFIDDPLSLGLVMVIALLIPFEAINSISEIMFAVFAKPRALFVRRYVVGPGLKIAAVFVVFMLESGVHMLAYAYVAASMLETVYSAVVLQRLLHRQGLWKHFRPAAVSLPIRRVFASSLPLAISDLLPPLRASLTTIVLEFFHGSLLVAAYRSVFPVARLNHVTLDSFKMLFTPTISRHYARGDRDGIEHAYWTSSAWVAVITFPFFIMCVSVPDAVATWLFGAKYASSGPLLAIMTVGFYISAVLGFGRHVLRVNGKVSVLFWSDLLSASVAVALTFALVPRWSAIGGAVATASALVIGVAINQWSLWRWNLIRTIDRSCLPLFALILAATAATLLVRLVFHPSVPFVLGTAAMGAVAVFAASHSCLDVATTFPEVGRLLQRIGWVSATGLEAADPRTSSTAQSKSLIP